MKKKLFISFSGGKTSAYMTKWLLENKRNDYNQIVILFSNTGQENEETLEFVNKCDREWDLGVIWLEAKVMHGERLGSKYTITNYENASRNGEPFEEVIKKYGIPNKAYPHCTRELKLNPMTNYIKDLGWKKDEYETAIGIRADEMDRISSKMNELNLIYPLCELNKQTKKSINAWWSKQSFNLDLHEHEGNCSWCWKKSKRKLLTLCVDNPSIFDFPKKMEVIYGLNGHNIDGNKRVFFRANTSTISLLQESLLPFNRFSPHIQKAFDMFNDEMDSANGCSESCEVY